MRFQKSVKVMPGVRLNLSKSGVSTSIGGRGATVNVGKRGVRSTVGIPGTGLSWSSQKGWSETKQSSPADEIGHLHQAALNAVDVVGKEAEKFNAVGTRINRAISTLNSGRGLTEPKAQTFEKRILAEEEKVSDLEENVGEQLLFLEAIKSRLRDMQFGIFAGGKKRVRDDVLETVEVCVRETKSIGDQLAAGHQALSDKLSEVQDELDGESMKGKSPQIDRTPPPVPPVSGKQDGDEAVDAKPTPPPLPRS